MRTYQAILEKFVPKTVLAKVALENWQEPDTLSLLSEKISGPVLLGYVLWILHEAEKREIDTLYFLARDGYILHQIAIKVCNVLKIPIICRYLYCSRNSLRLPTYSFIGEEAFTLLLNKSSNLTMYKLMERVGFSESERKEIYTTIGLPKLNENRFLTNIEYETLKKLLKNNSTYVNKVIEKSKDAYDVTIGYLRQEGLFASKQVAIVDSGWTGSMQRSLRQLMKSAGYGGKFIGFYFGMFAEPKEKEDGEYLTWYFDAKSALQNKVYFCNNLFEIMLSAPHGTTLTYCNKNGNYEPVLKNNVENMDSILEQNNNILKYLEKVLMQKELVSFNLNAIRKMTSKLLKRMMVYPTKKELAIWEGFSFCDDITDQDQQQIVSKTDIEALKQYLLYKRIYKKLCEHVDDRSDVVSRDLFWVWGEIQYLPVYSRWWYRTNFVLGEFVRLSI